MAIITNVTNEIIEIHEDGGIYQIKKGLSRFCTITRRCCCFKKNIFGKIKKVALNNEYSNTQKHLHLLFWVLLQ